ncbi:hypothetical protein ABE438_18410 [Bosea sp. TWI1241]|uniref:ImuA family protein n=1 Tax=Bosea sp. TWI1241 TaxID=3148904 RepID=UPI0032086F40
MLDVWLGGGLARAALHEICAPASAIRPVATLVALGLACRAAGARPVLWIRQDAGRFEVGGPYPAGLAELGLAPDRLLLMRGRDSEAVLRAGVDAARSAALGAVLIEPWGEPARLDLTTSRRLLLAAEQSGVFTLLLRAGGPIASAALTRWRVAPLPSRPREAAAPGDPAFSLALLRHRGGIEPREWSMEWNRGSRSFQPHEQPRLAATAGPRRPAPALSGGVAAFPGDRPAAAARAGDGRRRAG